MIIISDELVLSELSTDEEEHPNAPLIGWHNLITIDNVSASSENENYPAINLANQITSPIARWQAADDGAQIITVEVNSIDEIDYIAIARHNLGSTNRSITIQGSDGGGSPDWHELVQEVILPSNDAPTIFRYDPQALTHVRMLIGEAGSGIDPAEIAVMYVGKLLPLQRRIYVGHTPIPYGRSPSVLNGETEAGDFLGRIVTSEMLETGVELQNLTPNWYRSKLDPFVRSSKENPFFFAWRPGDYPDEVGFAWMTNKPQPRNQRQNGMMMIDFQMRGISP